MNLRVAFLHIVLILKKFLEKEWNVQNLISIAGNFVGSLCSHKAVNSLFRIFKGKLICVRFQRVIVSNFGYLGKQE